MRALWKRERSRVNLRVDFFFKPLFVFLNNWKKKTEIIQTGKIAGRTNLLVGDEAVLARRSVIQFWLLLLRCLLDIQIKMCRMLLEN